MEPRGALSVPAFRALWTAGLIADTGDWLLLIALPIVVYQLTGSALGTSAAFAAELGPGIALAPLALRRVTVEDLPGASMSERVAPVPRELFPRTARCL